MATSVAQVWQQVCNKTASTDTLHQVWQQRLPSSPKAFGQIGRAATPPNMERDWPFQLGRFLNNGQSPKVTRLGISAAAKIIPRKRTSINTGATSLSDVQRVAGHRSSILQDAPRASWPWSRRLCYRKGERGRSPPPNAIHSLRHETVTNTQMTRYELKEAPQNGGNADCRGVTRNRAAGLRDPPRNPRKWRGVRIVKK